MSVVRRPIGVSKPPKFSRPSPTLPCLPLDSHSPTPALPLPSLSLPLDSLAPTPPKILPRQRRCFPPPQALALPLASLSLPPNSLVPTPPETLPCQCQHAPTHPSVSSHLPSERRFYTKLLIKASASLLLSINTPIVVSNQQLFPALSPSLPPSFLVALLDPSTNNLPPLLAAINSPIPHLPLLHLGQHHPQVPSPSLASCANSRAVPDAVSTSHTQQGNNFS